MTATLPAMPKFPGYSLAMPRPGGGWERLRGADVKLLPTVDLDTIRPCPTNGYTDRGVYERQWCCTAHVEGWHLATVLDGHVVAVWADAAARVNRPQADESEA